MKSLLLLVSFFSLTVFGCKPNCSDVHSADILEKCERTADCMQGLRCKRDYDNLGEIVSRAACMPGGELNKKVCANKRLSAYGDVCRVSADCDFKVRCSNGRCFDGMAIPETPDSAYVIPHCGMLGKQAMRALDSARGPCLADKAAQKSPCTFDHTIAYQNIRHVCATSTPAWIIVNRLCIYKARSRKAILACGRSGAQLVAAYDYAFRYGGGK